MAPYAIPAAPIRRQPTRLAVDDFGRVPGLADKIRSRGAFAMAARRRLGYSLLASYGALGGPWRTAPYSESRPTEL